MLFVVVVVVGIYLSHTQSYQVQSAVKCRGLFKKFTVFVGLFNQILRDLMYFISVGFI